jgi:hypothetical protein
MKSMTQVAPLWVHKSGLLVLIALCAACSTTDRHFAQMGESLAIQIMPDSSKQFIYRLSLPAGAPPDPQVVQLGAAQRGTAQPDRRAYQRLRENVDLALAQTGYCRAGYLELDRRLARHTLWLRGECREGATDEDLNEFGGLHSLPLGLDSTR